MKFVGICFMDYPNMELHHLYEYIYDIEIVILYDDKNPFRIKQLCIRLPHPNPSQIYYEIFECDIPALTDVEAKAIARSIAKNEIKRRMNLIDYYKTFLEERN